MLRKSNIFNSRWKYLFQNKIFTFAYQRTNRTSYYYDRGSDELYSLVPPSLTQSRHAMFTLANRLHYVRVSSIRNMFHNFFLKCLFSGSDTWLGEFLPLTTTIFLNLFKSWLKQYIPNTFSQDSLLNSFSPQLTTISLNHVVQ